MLANKELMKIRELCKENPEFGRIYNSLQEERCQVLESINYEFKNYFALILGNAQLMETKDDSLLDNPNWLQLVGDIKKVYELIEQFSLYAACDQVVRETINIQSVVQNIFEQFHGLSIIKEIDLKLEVAEDAKEISQAYVTDHVKLKEILLNLVKNAVEAVEVGGKIIVVIEKEQENILNISVKSTRAMMAAEEKEEIFKPQYISKQGRHGLSLPLCAKFAAMLDGSIKVDSTEEETSFQVCLPIAG